MKRILYAVDPGKHTSAVAAFLNDELVGVWFASADSMDMAEDSLGEVAMEQPRAYGNHARPQDLLDLTAAGMAVATRLVRPMTRVRMIQPQEWKGQVPKPITRKRIEAKLTQSEKLRLGDCLKKSRGEKHNLFDAVGIGLFALKRVGRGCT